MISLKAAHTTGAFAQVKRHFPFIMLRCKHHRFTSGITTRLPRCHSAAAHVGAYSQGIGFKSQDAIAAPV
jgi:hypothetical protein